jgi:DNA-binding GntR family transcriptional regulator
MEPLADLKPIDDQTRRGQIVRRLRELIVGGQVSPGARLTETDLATRLGVSRAPLREAIRELVDSGLVVSIPYKGLFVRSITRRDLEELYSLRTALEQLAFREAWGKRDAAACDDLKSRNTELTRVITEGTEPRRAIELELTLHSWCYELAGHSLLQQTWARMKSNLQFYFMLHQKAHGRKGPLREAHDLYVACACGDDLDAMLRHLEDHMRQGLETTKSFLPDDYAVAHKA